MPTIQASLCKTPEVERKWAYQPGMAPVASSLVNGHRAAEINGVRLIDNWHLSRGPAVIDG